MQVTNYIGDNEMRNSVIIVVIPFLLKESISKENVWIVGNPENSESYYKQVSADVWVLTCNDTNTKIRILRQLARLYNLADDDLVFSLVPQKDKGETLDL